MAACYWPSSHYIPAQKFVPVSWELNHDLFTVGAVLLDLTAAYDTVWRRGLTCKLLRLLPDRHMVHMIMDMVSNRNFTFTTGNGQRSRLQRLKNGVPQGSVLVPLLFNIYISDLPTTISRKYACADDLAIMHADGDWQAVKGALTKDMATLGEYLQTWKLKLSTTKTVLAVFHLNNKEAKRELKVNFNNETLPFCSEPKYFGVTLDRTLTYRRHLQSSGKKLTSRVALLRRLAGSGWGAGATALQTATLALVHSDCRVLRSSCLVPQCSHPPHWPHHQRRLTNCDWMPASYTSGQPSNPRRYPTCWVLSSQWSHTVPRAPCHGAWTSTPLSVHPSTECCCTAPQIETPICIRHTATHQLLWQQQHTCGAVGG